MKRIKIAIYHNLPGGGARKAINDIARGLEERGHEVDAYNGENFHSIGTIKKYGIQYLLPVNLWRYKKFCQKLASEINRKNYDAAIITNSRVIQHPYLTQFLTIPKILISQEIFRAVYEKNLAEEIVFKRHYSGFAGRLVAGYSFFTNLFRKNPDFENLKKADKLIVNSCFSKENFLFNYGVLGQVAYPGVDADIFRPGPEEKRENYILSVGIYHPIKAHDLVIRALSLIPKEKRPLLKIKGWGDSGIAEKELAYLKNLAVKLGMEKEVIFVKDFLKDNIVDYYQKAYLTVAVHYLEPYGFTPLESMACGTPVVAVKEGGFRETVKDGETGLLVERDPKELAKAILYLLENREAWKRFSDNGPKWVKDNFSLEQTIDKVEKELYSLVNSKH